MSKKSKEEQTASANPAPAAGKTEATQKAQDAGSENAAAPESTSPGDVVVQERPARRGAAGWFALLAMLIALAAAGVSVWQSVELRRMSGALDMDLARKLTEIETIGSDSRRLSGDARDIARDVESRLGRLEAELVGIKNQRLALESLYQDLSLSRDEWTLAEVEQILLVASQQLQLAGNVKAALIALEAADARLARSDRPQLTEVRRVIGEDIERLKTSPFVDVTGIGLQIERVIANVRDLPLAIETRPVTSASLPPAADQQGWAPMLDELWNDLLSLVRIERVDAPAAPLLTPEQSFFLRENLKLRLLGARIALLARDEATYQADLTEAGQWLRLYFDGDAVPVRASLETIDHLSKSEIVIDLPDVSASLGAVRNYRLLQERTVR